MNLSIIIPVYNSEKILDNLINQIDSSLSNTEISDNYEIILINDQSEDESWKKIKSLCLKNKFLKGINLRENFGQHNAIMAGLNNCIGKKIITMDDDLQHPPEFLINIYNELKNNDACYTYYKNRRHIKWKKIVSWANNIISSFLLNKSFHIYLSSFRGINRNVVNKIIQFKDVNVYLDSLILNATKNISMITVEHSQRLSGESNYTFKKLIKLWSNMVLNSKLYPLRFSSILVGVLKITIKLMIDTKQKKYQYSILEKTFND